MSIVAGCKINLGLAIKGCRKDGYHEIESVFLPLRQPHDILEIGESRSPGIRVSFSCADIDPMDNTVTKAYLLFARTLGETPGLDVHIHKGIPRGAGLGGGSSDAAALLLWLQERLGHPLSHDALDRLAAGVGADVPFFLRGCPCLVEGIGDRVTPLETEDPGACVVLVCPDLHISTKWAFARWDELAGRMAACAASRNLTSQIDGDNAFFRFRTAGDARNVRRIPGIRSLGNHLEEAVFPAFPFLARIREFLEERGAAMSAMTGSGSSIYGIFRAADRRKAEIAAESLRRSYSRVYLEDIS